MAPTSAAILLAGGAGSRIEADVNKVYLPIGPRTMLGYSLETLASNRRIGAVVLVVREGDRSRAESVVDAVGPAVPVEITTGGPTRHRSEAAGLSVLRDRVAAEEIELVAIHDGARPFVTHRLLESVLDRARTHGGAVPALPIAEPLYRIDPGGVTPLPVEELRRVQTPQAFRAAELVAAYEGAGAAGFEGVDTAEAVERFSSMEVVTVDGDPRNIKVTFVEDFFAAEEFAASWAGGVWTA